MKNVIVFALGSRRHAIELRWVREVITLGPLTPVPSAPTVIAAAVNVDGAIVPVMRLPQSADPRPPRPGDSAIVIDVEGARAAIYVDTVHSVSTLETAPDGAQLVDPRGSNPTLIEPPALVADAIAACQAVARVAV